MYLQGSRGQMHLVYGFPLVVGVCHVARPSEAQVSQQLPRHFSVVKVRPQPVPFVSARACTSFEPYLFYFVS